MKQPNLKENIERVLSEILSEKYELDINIKFEPKTEETE